MALVAARHYLQMDQDWEVEGPGVEIQAQMETPQNPVVGVEVDRQAEKAEHRL